MEGTPPSSRAACVLSRDIRYSLFGYEHDDLMQLNITILREECRIRGILVGSSPQKRTCVRELLVWKKAYVAAEKPFSFDLVAERESLVDRLDAMDIASLRDLCRERDIAGSADLLYHRSDCISRILSFQKKNIAANDLAVQTKQGTIIR